MDVLFDHLQTSHASLDCPPPENVMVSTFLACNFEAGKSAKLTILGICDFVANASFSTAGL
jgi:hypothetical protein